MLREHLSILDEFWWPRTMQHFGKTMATMDCAIMESRWNCVMNVLGPRLFLFLELGR